MSGEPSEDVLYMDSSQWCTGRSLGLKKEKDFFFPPRWRYHPGSVLTQQKANIGRKWRRWKEMWKHPADVIKSYLFKYCCCWSRGWFFFSFGYWAMSEQFTDSLSWKTNNRATRENCPFLGWLLCLQLTVNLTQSDKTSSTNGWLCDFHITVKQGG